MKKKLFCGISVCLLFLPLGIKAQDKVKDIADKACACTDKINATGMSREKIIEEINSCIRSTSLMAQLTSVYAQTEEDKKLDNTKKEYNITVGENDKEVQAYLNKNCESVKKLMAVNVEPVQLSKNKKALKFYEEGLVYSQEKKYDLAVVSYNKAVKEDPKFITAWNYLGLNYRRLNNFNEAIKCYKKSLELDPKGMMPLQNTAIAYEYLQDYENASVAYEKFIAAYPENPEGYYGGGRTFYLLGNYEKGLDYTFRAYNMYTEAQSPYANDAQQALAQYYKELNEMGKLELFMQAAKNNNIEIKE